jgi:hypothetical protein
MVRARVGCDKKEKTPSRMINLVSFEDLVLLISLLVEVDLLLSFGLGVIIYVRDILLRYMWVGWITWCR